ncbi:MAG: 50S ribosomal protein L10 [Rickettsiaceae bacterium]|nr:MAG: 50S ribosomal protein L10 [Rickettsiaceae bacterium]
MLKSEKREFVSSLENIYNQSNSVIITHYHGLSVSKITALRKMLRENGANFKIVKNTLSKIAAETVGASGIATFLKGPTAIAYSSDALAAAKQIVEFAKLNNNLKVIGGIVNNQVVSAEEIQDLAKLPSLNELRSKIIGVVQEPAAQIARLLKLYSEKNN